MKLHRFSFRLFYFLLFTFYFLLFHSCKPRTDHSKEISQLDSALAKLKEAEKIISSVDTNAFRISYNFSSEKLHNISEKISKDTIKKNSAAFLITLYAQNDNLQNLLDNKKYLERAIIEGEQRISDLKHDLSEDLIDKNKSAGYVVDEVTAAGKIADAVIKVVSNAQTSVSKIDSMKTKIIFIADSLQSK